MSPAKSLFTWLEFNKFKCTQCTLWALALFLSYQDLNAAPPIEAATDTLLKPYRITYRTENRFLMPFKSTVTHELKQQENGHWKLTERIKAPLIKCKRKSYFEWDQNHLKVNTYLFAQRSLTQSKNIRLEFDWQTLKAVDKTATLPTAFDLAPGTLDRTSYLVQLRLDLMQKQPLKNYTLIGSDGIKTYRFETIGEEPIETTLGVINTIKLRRIDVSNPEDEEILWLAPEWDYSLVRLERHENNHVYTLAIKGGVLNGKPLVSPEATR